MDYFMRCPDMPLEPPDNDTRDNRRYWQIKERLEDIEIKQRRLEDEKEELKMELEAMGWTN